MKDEHEFLDTAALPWKDVEGLPGVTERVLSAGTGDAGELTRLTRWQPGFDSSAAGIIQHDYYEEVYLLDGELHDLTLGTTFTAGHYASRPPGMPHGPYRTAEGCTMLEIRHRPTAP
jgi:hypothetical protein